MYYRKNEAKEERDRQKAAARLLSESFPSVKSIVVKMTYIKHGKESLLRTLSYYPSSSFFFRISCLGEGCGDGELDVTRRITDMIRNNRKASKGVLTCNGTDPSAIHADIECQVAITYV